MDNRQVQFIGSQTSQDDETDNKKDNRFVTSPGPIDVPGVTQGGTAPTPVEGGANVSRAGSRGSGFTGIKRVLAGSQGSKVGQTVTGRLKSSGEQARANIEKSRQEFQKQSGEAEGEMATKMGVAGTAVKNILQTGQPLTQTTVDQFPTTDFTMGLDSATPVGPVYETPKIDPSAAFQSIASGKYKGPMGIENVEELGRQAARASSLARLTGETQGRQELLKQQFGRRGGYGRAQSELDALLLAKTSAKDLAKARAGLSGIQRELTTEELSAIDKAEELKERAQQYKKQLLGQTETGISGISSEVENRVKTLKDLQEDQLKRATESFKTGEFDEDVAQALGFSSGDMLPAYPSEELIKDALKKTEAARFETAISKPEYAKLAALSGLAGRASPSTLMDILAKNKAEAAGTYTTGITKSNEAIENRLNEYSRLFDEMAKNRDMRTLFSEMYPSGDPDFGVIENNLINIRPKRGDAVAADSFESNDPVTLDKFKGNVQFFTDSLNELSSERAAILKKLRDRGPFESKEWRAQQKSEIDNINRLYEKTQGRLRNTERIISEAESRYKEDVDKSLGGARKKIKIKPKTV